MWMKNSVDPNQLVSSGSTLFKNLEKAVQT